jgi:hypothetical protein
MKEGEFFILIMKWFGEMTHLLGFSQEISKMLLWPVGVSSFSHQGRLFLAITASKILNEFTT